MIELARAVAEDAQAYLSGGPGLVLEDLGDVVVRHREQGPHYWWGAAMRPRFAEGRAEERIEAVRAWMRGHGRDAFNWQVGESATPSDLPARLLAAGAVPDAHDPEQWCMVLDREPPAGRSDLDIRPIETVEHYADRMRIIFEDEPPEALEAQLASIGQGFRTFQALGNIGLLAYADGHAVAEATLTILTNGVPYLSGASTLRAYRGNGMYTTMVRRRWDAAVALGTPVLVVQGGPMSGPILKSLGFEQVATAWTFVDSSGLAGG